ncbi:MAG: hypothetical protein Q27BB25_14520 [Blastomonas sp. CACIA14H2]|jgi:hypothetical protein|uniref:hypothetical protein n=1 Tax=unclassified Blastomonas TaxID=2626550 RepID=UPI0003D00281|nr:hypothetical protein [Blastomonas sp. UPD001]ESZ86384.1 MAG: hypothetical protein Q27BB25_14520 [Blastomonas sp. CACIA14H2]MBL0967479.1 hypothetical protein [Blastomonas sp.]
MFVPFDPDWPPFDPPRARPPRPPRRISPAQEKRLMQAIGLNLLLAIVAPIGGATVIAALLGWWG